MQKTDKSQYSVRTIARAALILGCLADGKTRITEISEQLGLNKATVYRLLQALEMSGFTIQDVVTKKYAIGSLIVRLASNNTVAHQGLILCATKEMENLNNSTRETVSLGVLTATKVICVSEIASQEHMRFSSGTGVAQSLTQGATGKMALAELPEKELQLIIKYLTENNRELKASLNLKKLDTELKKIRRQGYATSHGEILPGVAAISAPIRNYLCPVVLSIIGPEDRFGSKIPEYAPLLIKSAELISKNIAELNFNT